MTIKDDSTAKCHYVWWGIKIIRQRLLILSCLLVLVCWVPLAQGQELYFSIHPFANPTTIYRSFQPLVDYLSSQTGTTIVIRIEPNYSAHIRSLGSGEAEIGFVGPSPYVRVKDNFDNIELLVRFKMYDNSNDKMVIFCRASAPFKEIRELKGKSFAFGDYQSYGSHYMPRWFLDSKGIPPSSLTAYEFVHSHDNVILSVLHGDFDAGGVRLDVFNRYKDRSLRILAGPMTIPPHAIVCNSNLDLELKRKLRAALLSLSDKAILEQINPQLEGFTPVTDRDFDKARQVINFIEAR